jgi:LCP family protein required for cell wall assembly
MSYDDQTEHGLRSITLREEEEPPQGQRRRPRKKRRGGRTVVVILVSLVLLLGGGLVLTGFLVSERLGNQVDRIPDAFDIPEAGRPQKPTGAGAGAMNILLAGSDRRSEEATTGEGAGDAYEETGQRSDTNMVLHISADRKSAYLISIPRDSWVDIPGEGKNKMNAAYSLGGPKLYIQTVEKITGLRIDHLAVIDWNGFKALTDALGGVQMTFDKEVRAASGATFGPGTETLTGEEALDYVRERKHLPGGDFDRIKRQQNFLRSLMKQTLSNGTITNPVKLTNAMNAVTQNLSVDDKFTTGEMRDLAIGMRNLRGSGVTFMTVPTKGTGMEGSQSVVYLDATKSKALWSAVRSDDIAGWLAEHGKDDVLGDDVK